jgi:ubiquinone/menaquinone biosynthesis C-methylase UbiE
VPAPQGTFDGIAANYDAAWTNTAIGRAQRGLVWRRVDPLFRRGQAILDIGCGTGEDAAHFASRGVAVHAIDASPEMIREAARRGGFTTEVARAEEIAGGSYDGALSNFGALNCVADPAGVARALAAVVRPGGHVAICVIGRFCLWETLYYAARLQFGKAFRRVRSGGVASSMGVRVYYPSIAGLRAAFAGEFRCERWMGIGLLVPPSYVRLPDALVRGLARLDGFLTRVPMLRGMADHRLLILVRK